MTGEPGSLSRLPLVSDVGLPLLVPRSAIGAYASSQHER